MNRQQRRAQGKKPDHVHMMVAATAMELAGAAYEILASGNNDWYRANPSHKVFVMTRYGEFVHRAREILVDMLTDPGIAEDLKEEIADALMKDGGLNPPVMHAQQAAGLMH